MGHLTLLVYASLLLVVPRAILRLSLALYYL